MAIRPLTGQTLYSGNGAVVPASQGAIGRAKTGFRSSWNGNSFFSPPESGCVLYLPGHPGVGTTIQDFSFNFSDSAIDTDEALDAGELAIDCDADATAAIPVGSIIRIGTELRKVTATGATLTTVLYGPSETHDTNQDIFVWIPNNGTITGATWVRLPSGLWVLNFITDDHVALDSFSAIAQTMATGYVEFWGRITSNTTGAFFTVNDNNDANSAFIIYYNTSGTSIRQYCAEAGTEYYNAGFTGGTMTPGIWYHIVMGHNGTTPLCWVNGAQKAISGVHTDITKWISAVNTINVVSLGSSNPSTGRALYLAGDTTLLKASTTTPTTAIASSHYNQERHLFGV